MNAVSLLHAQIEKVHHAGTIGFLAASVSKRVRLWLKVRRERKLLLTLDEHMLKDIGISRVDAEREASRSFWDVERR